MLPIPQVPSSDLKWVEVNLGIKKVEGNSGMTACLSKLGMITDMLRISVWENLLLYWSVDQYNK